MAQTVKNPNAGDPGLIPGSGRSPGERNGYPLQCPCLENPMDRGAWQATVHGVTKSWTWMSDQAQHSKHVRQSLKMRSWISLVVQWLRILLPMQGTQVRSLIWKDPTRCGAAKLVLTRAIALQQGKTPSEKPHLEWPLFSATRRRLHSAIKTQCSQK